MLVMGERVEWGMVIAEGGGGRKPMPPGGGCAGNVAMEPRGEAWLTSSSTRGTVDWFFIMFHLCQARGEWRVILVESTELRDALSARLTNTCDGS